MLKHKLWQRPNGLAKSWPGFILLTVLMAVIALLPEQIQQQLAYQATVIIDADYWRLITGHLVHSNYWHLGMNLGGLSLVLLLHGRYYSSSVFLLYVACSALMISYMILFCSSDIQVYVGLSGVLHAVLCIGAIKDIQYKEPTGKILLLGLVFKVGYEQYQGPNAELGQLIDANVAIDAHLYGVISGCLLAFILSSTGFIQALKTATKPR